jgi:nucleoside-diphosphate-sugar epimerase
MHVRLPSNAMDDLRFPFVHAAGDRSPLGDAVLAELWAAGHELREADDELDAVVHCPAPMPPGRVTRRRLAAHRRANAARAASLAALALARRARLVHVGSALAWGDHGARWIDEATPQQPAPLGAGDAAVARRLLELRDREGLDVVLVAVGLVYGPGAPLAGAFGAPEGRVVGWGGNYLSCVHVDDAARAVAAALERGAAGATYLAADDEPLTQRVLADTVAAAAGRRRPGSAPIGLAGARFGYPLARSLAASVRIRNARARAELGWSPRFPSVRDGMHSASERPARPARRA